MVFPPDDSDESMRTEVDRIAALLGSVTHLDEDHYSTTKDFGLVSYRAVAITSRARARHKAHMSYQGSVTPDQSIDDQDRR